MPKHRPELFKCLFGLLVVGRIGSEVHIETVDRDGFDDRGHFGEGAAAQVSRKVLEGEQIVFGEWADLIAKSLISSDQFQGLNETSPTVASRPPKASGTTLETAQRTPAGTPIYPAAA